MVVNVAVISPRAYVFVEPRHLMQPVRPTTVVINNTTIINNTVNITKVKVVNNTVINEGPRTQIIEQASGKKVRSVAVRDLRRKQEATVVVQKHAAPVVREKIQQNVPAPVHADIQPRPTTNPGDAQRRASEAEAKRVALAESQKQAREAAAKAQQQARLDATEARLEAQRKAAEAADLKSVPPHAKETPANLRPPVTAQSKPPQGLQQPHGKQNATNVVKHVPQKNGKKVQPAVEKPVAAPAPLEPVSDKK